MTLHSGSSRCASIRLLCLAALTCALALSTSIAVSAGFQARAPLRHAAQLHFYAKPHYLVLLVLDGARPDYFHVTKLPNLDKLRQQGVEYDRAWAGILESETPSGHAAISTGSTPAHDGLLGFNWVKSGNGAPVRLFDPVAVRSGAMERVMQQAGAPTIASLFKKRYPHARVVAISGHKYYAADPLGGPNADYIMYYQGRKDGHYVPTAIPGHVPPASVLNGPHLTSNTTSLAAGVEDNLAVRLAMRSFHKVHQQVTLINLPEFDWPLGHVYGTERNHIITLMQSFDRDLGRIEHVYRSAGVLKRTTFIITSDHGMTPLVGQIPDSLLANAVSQARATSLETAYETAGYIWLRDHSQSAAVASNVVRARDRRIQSVYYKVWGRSGPYYVRAPGLAVSKPVESGNQVLLSSFQGGNAPDVVALCREHISFVTRGAEKWKGNHGGASWESQHIPLLIAGAGTAWGRVSHAPARLEDIAPTALALFEIPATGMQGKPLADALQAPSRQQVRDQASLVQLLGPGNRALAAQALYEERHSSR